jgi:hypothetical protein
MLDHQASRSLVVVVKTQDCELIHERSELCQSIACPMIPPRSHILISKPIADLNPCHYDNFIDLIDQIESQDLESYLPYPGKLTAIVEPFAGRVRKSCFP